METSVRYENGDETGTDTAKVTGVNIFKVDFIRLYHSHLRTYNLDFYFKLICFLKGVN